jgi:hypothetical protein
VPKRRLARRDHLLRELVPLFRQHGERCEQAAVRVDQIRARQHDGDERCRQKPVDLPLDGVVNARDSLRGLFFDLVVFDQQPGDGRTERSLPCLQRDTDLRAGVGVAAAARKREHLIHCRPELGEGVPEKQPLIGRARERRDLFFPPQRVVQVHTQAVELR